MLMSLVTFTTWTLKINIHLMPKYVTFLWRQMPPLVFAHGRHLVPSSRWDRSNALLQLPDLLCSSKCSAFPNHVLHPPMYEFSIPLTQCDQLHTHYFVSCRTTTSKQGSQRRWWTPRQGTCPSPTSSTSPSWPRRRPRPSLCQRLTMRWPRNIYNLSNFAFLQAMMYLTGRRHFKACTNLWISV